MIGQLKEQSVKGYLKKMFDHVLAKFKENENISEGITSNLLVNPSLQRTTFTAFNRQSIEVSLDVKY